MIEDSFYRKVCSTSQEIYKISFFLTTSMLVTIIEIIMVLQIHYQL